MAATVLFLCGSLRAESVNRRVMMIAAQQLPEGYDPVFMDLSEIPPYNSDRDGEHAPDAVRELRAHANSAAGVFWVTPEYNYGLPGHVKNVIDWLSRPLIPQSAIIGRPMNVVVATTSLTNGIRSLTDLKRYWTMAGGAVVPIPEYVIQAAASKFVDDDGTETLEPATLKMVRLAVANLIRLIESGVTATFEENWREYIKALTT